MITAVRFVMYCYNCIYIETLRERPKVGVNVVTVAIRHFAGAC